MFSRPRVSRPRDHQPTFREFNAPDRLQFEHMSREGLKISAAAPAPQLPSQNSCDERPKTANGAVRRTFEPSLHHTHTLMLKRRSSAPISPQFGPVSAITPTSAAGIGIALGSPTQVQMRSSPKPLEDSTVPPEPSAFAPLRTSRVTKTAPQETKAKPRGHVDRLKAVSGFFGRKRSPSPVQKFMGNSEAESGFPGKGSIEVSRSSTQRKRSQSIRFKRTQKPQALTPDSNYYKSMDASLRLQTNLGHAQRDQILSPQIEVHIPSSAFERYSVMFPSSSQTIAPQPTLLERRQAGVEKLNIQASNKARNDHQSNAKPAACTLNRALTSPALSSARVSLSLFPNPPKFPKRDASLQPSRLKRSHTTIGLPSPKLLETDAEMPEPLCPSRPPPPPPPHLAFYETSPPSSPSATHSPRTSRSNSLHQDKSPRAASFSTLDASSSGTYEEYDHLSMWYPSPMMSYESPATSYTACLSPPEPFWESGKLHPSTSPSPSYSPSTTTPSPRLQYGYDAPHSPLVAIAKTVSVIISSNKELQAQPEPEPPSQEQVYTAQPAQMWLTRSKSERLRTGVVAMPRMITVGGELTEQSNPLQIVPVACVEQAGGFEYQDNVWWRKRSLVGLLEIEETDEDLERNFNMADEEM